MAWFRLDDQWLRHPKTQALSKDAKLLWIAGGLHCAAHLTNGEIVKSSLRLIAAEADVRTTCAADLVAVGLWHDLGDRYEVHQWLDYQPSREHVEKERSKARERMKNKRASSGEVPPNVPPNGGRSSPSPTRPDPTRPRGVTSENKTDRQNTVAPLPPETPEADSPATDSQAPVGRSVEFDSVIEILTAHAEDTSPNPIIRRDRWIEQTQLNLIEERGPDVRRLLVEGRTPQEVACLVAGDGLAVRAAMRKRGMNVHAPKGWGETA